jgi:hypothetical protein
VEGPNSAKFRVNFPVSREFGAETGFEADCILRVGGFELLEPQAQRGLFPMLATLD